MPDLMRGKVGAVLTSEFAELVRQNERRTGSTRFIASRWGRYNGAPASTCTLVVGHLEAGHGYNVGMPQVPEFTITDHKTGRIIHRGWRELLKNLLLRRVIVPSSEVAEWLGFREMEKIGQSLVRNGVPPIDDSRSFVPVRVD